MSNIGSMAALAASRDYIAELKAEKDALIAEAVAAERARAAQAVREIVDDLYTREMDAVAANDVELAVRFNCAARFVRRALAAVEAQR